MWGVGDGRGVDKDECTIQKANEEPKLEEIKSLLIGNMKKSS